MVHPKADVHFLIAANETGLQHFMKQNKLNKGFACASQLGNPPQRPRQLKITIQQKVPLPGLYPPKHYPKAINTTATAWSPEEQPTSEEFSQVCHKTELKFRPDEIIYTDGSRKKIPGIGLVKGSGVYRTEACTPESQGASIWAGHAEHHQQGRTGGAADGSKAPQTRSEGERSNRL